MAVPSQYVFHFPQIDVFLDTVRPDVYDPQALTKEHPRLQKVTGPHTVMTRRSVCMHGLVHRCLLVSMYVRVCMLSLVCHAGWAHCAAYCHLTLECARLTGLTGKSGGACLHKHTHTHTLCVTQHACTCKDTHSCTQTHTTHTHTQRERPTYTHTFNNYFAMCQ